MENVEPHTARPEPVEAPFAILPTGEKYYVIGPETAVSGTIKILEKSGFDRFRTLHSAEAPPAGTQIK